MKNADQPINPCLMQQVGDDSFRANKPNDPKEWNIPMAGLTKREYFAGLAMQGLCSTSVKGTFETIEDMYNSVATHSVKIADALLTQLETKD